MRPLKNTSGFSTIIAILMTAFLTILSASIMNLFVVENGMNHFLSDGISAYMSAEWALEYSLLKSSNHREGFSDTITSSDLESSLLDNNTSLTKKTSITSILRASDTSYTGTITPGGFEVIPLFYDKGKTLQSTANNNPNKNTSDIQKTPSFLMTQDGNISWNIIGNDGSGTTFGISGTGWVSNTFGILWSPNTTQGFEKHMGSDDIMTASMTGITNFISTYYNNYLILSNISSNDITYHLSSTDTFSLPIRTLHASSTVGKSKQNIDFSENRSRLFDMLKYSVFSQ